MGNAKTKLMAGVAAIALLGTPAIAQTWEEEFGDASSMQMQEAAGQRVVLETGEPLGKISDFAIQDDQLYVIVIAAEGNPVPIRLEDMRYEGDGFVADVDAADIRNASMADIEGANRIHDEATFEMAFREVERRGAVAAGEENVSTETVQTAGGQFVVEQAEPKVTVDVPDPQVSVSQNAPEVTVEQPEPTITVTQSKPDVMVEQQAPVVTVEQAQPTVSVDIPEPVVTIQMPEPDVNVAQQQPNVQVQQPEPVVRFERPEPNIVIEDAEAQVRVSEAEAQVNVTTADQAQVAIDQGEPNVDMRTAGDADVTVSQADAKVRVEPAEGANVAVEQAEADVNVVEEEQTAEISRDQQVQTEAEMAAADGFVIIAIEDLDPVEIEGTGVYDRTGDRIGEIERVMSDELIIEVGGFLGLGEKEVALPKDRVSLQRSEVGDMVRAYVDTTEEQLENMADVQ
ncbi:PRC-barrel domain-containing protein [Tranquillimonas alkanivorans]|uniref:PRC-barrel domain-containing protein n=1 Tax=Tranquillimonas alkanivorans TaxID=441119 RepID=A0A1I5U860_9RHOB|nr:PRC-barrel domain-containing protein [Tranquillimonas alkanivorans]SFP91491.1 PRC-barrel domain-containing protein [Tranquillimonas alkanivorans]